MRVQIHIGDTVYYTPHEDVKITDEKLRDFRDKLPDLTSLQFELEDGSYLILTSELIGRSHFIVEP